MLRLEEQAEAQYLVLVEVPEAGLEVILEEQGEHGVVMELVAVVQAEVSIQLALLEPTTHLAVGTVVAEAGLAHRLEQAAREESLEAVAVVEQVQVAAVRHQVVTAVQGVVLKSGCGFTDERNN